MGEGSASGVPWGDGLGKGGWERTISNGISNAQTCATPRRCAHVADETTRDVVGLGNPRERCLTHMGRCTRRWDGGQLAMTQEARDDRLLGVLFLTARTSIYRLPTKTRGALLG